MRAWDLHVVFSERHSNTPWRVKIGYRLRRQVLRSAVIPLRECDALDLEIVYGGMRSDVL